jgi:hypothetical protein
MARSVPDPTPPTGERPISDRVLIARIAAGERWARTLDRTAAT